MFEELYELSKIDRVALNDGKNKLSFHDLWTRSEAVAWFLKENYKRDKAVAIFGDKENDMVVCMIGAAKAGKPYVAILSYYPDNKINHILNDANVDLVLNLSGIERQFGDKDTIDVIPGSDIDAMCLKYANRDTCVVDEIDPEDILFYLYTSGSTGVPKRVDITRRNISLVLEVVKKQNSDYDALNTEWTTFMLVSYGFSASLGPVYSGLCIQGKTLYSVPKEKIIRTSDLLNELLTVNPTSFMATPTLLSHLLQDSRFNDENLTNIQSIGSAGEALTPGIAKEIKKRFKKAQFFNGYGTTETCSDGSNCLITDDLLDKDLDYMPIGYRDSKTVFIVDKEGNPITEDDVKGELIIHGPCVSNGYPDKELTNKAFYTLEDGTKAYRTKDICYYKDGYLFFTGRADNQVKVGGNRIEIEEAEFYLKSCSIVQNAAISLKTDNGVNSLVGFVILNEEGKKLKKLDAFLRIKKELKDTAESQFIPQKLIFVDSLPNNINNKLDRVKLKEMAQNA